VIISFGDKVTEALFHARGGEGDLQGFYSIRVNDQWRIIFRWEDGNASEVQVVDYH
jgi:plasmid maintenance system killer protein